MDTHSEEQRQKNLRRLRNLIGSYKGPPRRNKFLPGEGPEDYRRKLWEAISSGMTEVEFEWHRLVKNGWSLEDERKYREHARVLAYDSYHFFVKEDNNSYRRVGIDLVDAGDELMARGKFPGQKIRTPGEDDEEVI